MHFALLSWLARYREVDRRVPSLTPAHPLRQAICRSDPTVPQTCFTGRSTCCSFVRSRASRSTTWQLTAVGWRSKPPPRTDMPTIRAVIRNPCRRRRLKQDLEDDGRTDLEMPVDQHGDAALDQAAGHARLGLRSRARNRSTRRFGPDGLE